MPYCIHSSNSNTASIVTKPRDVHYCPFSQRAVALPWHHLQNLPRHTTEPSTDLHVIRWNPNLTLTLGAVDVGMPWGLPWDVVGLPWDVVAVSRGLPRWCHGTPMESYATPWDAMVCHGWYHGNATACHEEVKKCRTLQDPRQNPRQDPRQDPRLDPRKDPW